MSSTGSKKRFAGSLGFDSLLNVKHGDDNEGKAQSRTPESPKKVRLVRTTHVLREDLLETFRDIAYWERRLLKDLMEEAMVALVDRYTAEKGPVQKRKDVVV
jgi:hypothetical protein